MSKQVVISGENRVDDYGNFFFKDKGGEEHKIGEKRKNYDELVSLITENPDKAVSLSYDEYKGRSYIVDAQLVGDHIQVDESELTKQQVEPQPRQVVKSDTKNRAFALSYTKDLVVAGKIGIEDMLRRAEEYSKWLDGVI